MAGMQLDIHLVVAGLALAEAQTDKQGRVLLPKDTDLTESVVAFLSRSGVSTLCVKRSDPIKDDGTEDGTENT